MPTVTTTPMPVACERGAITEHVGLRLIQYDKDRREWTFESVQRPFALGNLSPMAYGGCTIGIAVAAAVQSIAKEDVARLQLYSVVGQYLGPTPTTSTSLITVTSLRDTRSFATRLVVVKQQADSSSTPRNTMSALVDFIGTRGDRTLSRLTYSAQPRVKVITPPDRLLTYHSQLDSEFNAGRLDERVRDAVKATSRQMMGIVDQRLCPEGVWYDNLNGIAPKRPTHQDHLPVPEKVAYDWFKQRRVASSTTTASSASDDVLLPPTPHTEAACLFALILDAAIAFSPLSFTHRFIYDDVEACSTLDFALRLHVDDLRPDHWNLREIVTHAGGHERTHGEARVWQQDDDGRKTLVATMTQSSVIRSVAADKTKAARAKAKAAKL